MQLHVGKALFPEDITDVLLNVLLKHIVPCDYKGFYSNTWATNIFWFAWKVIGLKWRSFAYVHFVLKMDGIIYQISSYHFLIDSSLQERDKIFGEICIFMISN
jgi:hypothetical protein